METEPGQTRHAIVIGGSVAGMVAARILTEHFDHVTLIERDRAIADPHGRPRLPQGRHLHVLLVRGHQILEQLFPAIKESLVAAGAKVKRITPVSVPTELPLTNMVR